MYNNIFSFPPVDDEMLIEYKIRKEKEKKKEFNEFVVYFSFSYDIYNL
jgi:hypothetical protein